MSLETYGRYQLLKKLAAGGMAQIYLARQQGPEGFEKLLVVKRILPHLAENEDFITMFLDEARIAARLNHPNVVQIFDLGAQDDSYFIAMEFIHGEDLRRVWKHAEREGKPIPIALMLRIIIDACSGLDYAHKKADQTGRALNIVHRDVSPQNILVSFDGAVKVVDFGIAKAADQSTVTQSGVLKGKYSYMSPEQAAGQDLDARSDIFALGVVLYELLTNTRLFKRQNDIQTLNAVTACVVEPPSKVNPQLPAELDAIVMKALARNREERFADARQFGQALERWLLDHQLPSSTAELSEFMHDVYAERLAREAEEGRVLFETVENESFAERATPSGEFKRPTRATGSRRQPSKPKLEPTVASGSLRAANRAPTEASMPTLAQRGVKLPMVAVVVLLALLIGGGTAWYFARGDEAKPPPPMENPAQPPPVAPPVVAKIEPAPVTKVRTRIESVPGGAAVTLAGRDVGVTPLELELEPGVLHLALALEGFHPLEEELEVKEGAEPRRFTLTPVKKTAVKQPPPPKERATVRFYGAEARIECPKVGFKGETPPSDKQLPVGDYECSFSADGRRVTQAIHVEAGVVNKVRVEFP